MNFDLHKDCTLSGRQLKNGVPDAGKHDVTEKIRNTAPLEIVSSLDMKIFMCIIVSKYHCV